MLISIISSIVQKSESVKPPKMSSTDTQKCHIHTMEYYSAIKKEWCSDTHYNTDEPWKYYAKWNEPDTKGHILYDPIYIRYLE